MADAPLVQPQAYTADGKAIAPQDVPAAVASGNAFFQQGAKILARSSEGRLITVAPEDAAHPGVKVLAPEEVAAINEKRVYGRGFGNEAKAFGAGAARAASLGLSDVAARAIGGEEAASSLEALKRQNPISSGAGEVAGIVAPALLTGGGAALAEGAEAGSAAAGIGSGLATAGKVLGAPMRAVGAVGEAVGGLASGGLEAAGVGSSLAGRVASKAISLGASGATEGAIFGAGQTLSDSALKGDPLTTEALAAGMGQGALFGGVLGAGIGAAGELGGAVLGKLPTSEKLDEMATGFARKQLGRDFENVGKGQSREVAEGWKDASAGMLLERKIAEGPNAGKTVFEASTKPQDIADNIGQLRRDIGAEIGATREKAAAIMEANPTVAPDVEKLLADGDALVKSLRKQGVSGAMSQARAAERELKLLRQKIAETTTEIPGGFEVNVGAFEKSSMRAESSEYMRNHSAEEANRLGLPRIEIYEGERPAVADGRHRMQAAIDRGESSIRANVVRLDREGNVVSEQLQPIRLVDSGPAVERGNWSHTSIRELPAQPSPPTVDTYRALLDWHNDLEAQLNPKGVAKSMQAIAVKNQAALKRVSDLTNNFLKDTTAQALTAAGEDGAIVAQLHRDYAGALSMQQAAEKEAKRVASNRRVSLTDHMLGIGAALTHMASGNAGALATMALGGAAAIGNKIVREQGNAIAARIARRAARMTSLVDGAARSLSGVSEKVLPSATRAVIEAERPAPYRPSTQTELKANFAEVRGRLQELQNPQHQQAQLVHATGKIQTAYPEVASALSQQLLRAQAYLASQLPQPRGGSQLSPLAREASVPPREMQKFLSKVNAVMEPEAVIADIARGKLDSDAVAALEQVYPETFKSMQTTTLQYLSANKDEIPYSRRVHVSVVMKIPGDSSLGLRFAGLQSAIGEMDKPLQQGQKLQGGPAMPRLKGPAMKPGEDMTLPSAHAPGQR